MFRLSCLVLLLLFGCFANSLDSNGVVNCNIIFEERKNELINEIRNIEEQKRTMTTLFNQQQELNNKKLEELKLKEQQVESLINEAKLREKEIKNLISQNEELLSKLQEINNEKIGKTYAQMRDSKAAPIVENMSLRDAAELLYSMDAKNMSKILSKMNPQKAAKLTEILKSGPPFYDME